MADNPKTNPMNDEGPKSHKDSRIPDRQKVTRQVATVGVGGNIFLAAFKLFAGIFGNSTAMISDAVHSLSDVFAMGARPHVALNLLALDSELGAEVAGEILRGGADTSHAAGAFVAGGHTIDDEEPKYGLCVFGTVDPGKIVRNGGAVAGDILYLTKRIGTGIMSAAVKNELVTQQEFRPAVESMMELNIAGGEAMVAAGVHAATDVTGFGLAGHLHEMLKASNVAAELDFGAIPVFERVWELSCAYCRPNRAFSIMDLAEEYVQQGTLDDDEFDNRMGVICDPQTSGGILAAIPPDQAEVFEREFERRAGRAPWKIGRIVDGEAGTISFSDGAQ